MVGGLGGGVTVSTSGLRGVDGGALVGDIGDEAVVVVGGVGGGLDPAVGQGNGERSLHNTLGILGLGLLEVGLAVVVGDAVLVGEGLGGKLLNGGGVVGGRGAVAGGSSSVRSSDKGGGNDELKKMNRRMTNAK